MWKRSGGVDATEEWGSLVNLVKVRLACDIVSGMAPKQLWRKLWGQQKLTGAPSSRGVGNDGRTVHRTVSPLVRATMGATRSIWPGERLYPFLPNLSITTSAWRVDPRSPLGLATIIRHRLGVEDSTEALGSLEDLIKGRLYRHIFSGMALKRRWRELLCQQRSTDNPPICSVGDDVGTVSRTISILL